VDIYCLKLENPVVTLAAALLAVAALSLQASRYLSGVSGCSIWGIAPPLVWEGGVRVGKGHGYNHACAESALPSQNASIVYNR